MKTQKMKCLVEGTSAFVGGIIAFRQSGAHCSCYYHVDV